MKQQVANYTVIIEKQKRLGTKKDCYAAFVPILGIATDADTVEQAEKEITKLIQFHLESLAEEGGPIPVENEHALITRSEVNIPKGAVTV
ncbi:MAG TPA: type II toxin-antitoxin system HicB family antitoxin [Xanthomonadales bacterium]|nr:type II toxin-antitoxin system HicB family antitoxin [Xanthomonadales bacterium]